MILGFVSKIQAEKTQINQVRKILDTVPKRGPTAFNIFYEGLIDTGNDTAADILRPELRGSHPHHGGAGERGIAIPQDDVDLPQGLFIHVDHLLAHSVVCKF